MATILLIIQIFVVLALIGVILLQKTGSDSLAGLSSGGHNVFSGRSASNVFTKITIFLAIAFIVNSLLIAKVTKSEYLASGKSIVDSIEVESEKMKNTKKEQVKAPKVEE